MRQHKLALCKDHFLEWVPEQAERFIKKYEMFTRSDRVLVAVSGGKDSLSLWDILLRLGHEADGLYIGLGIDGGFGYSDESHRLAAQFAEKQGLKLHVVDVQAEYGQPIPILSEPAGWSRTSRFPHFSRSRSARPPLPSLSRQARSPRW